jgi:DNA-binding transcriptional regulator YhcF (GntR family)
MHTVRGAYLKLRDQGVIRLRLGRRAVIAAGQLPVDAAVEADLKQRIGELVTDALLAGYTPDSFQQLVNTILGEMQPE